MWLKLVSEISFMENWNKKKLKKNSLLKFNTKILII